MANPTSRRQIKSAIDENWEHFQAPNLQIGYVYGREFTRGPADYQKELVPGARLAHHWLFSRGQRMSSLDLIQGLEFVLITPSDFTDVEKFDVNGVPVLVQQRTRDFEAVDGSWDSFMSQAAPTSAILVRPDHHIVDIVTSLEAARLVLANYIKS